MYVSVQPLMPGSFDFMVVMAMASDRQTSLPPGQGTAADESNNATPIIKTQHDIFLSCHEQYVSSLRDNKSSTVKIKIMKQNAWWARRRYVDGRQSKERGSVEGRVAQQKSSQMSPNIHAGK